MGLSVFTLKLNNTYSVRRQIEQPFLYFFSADHKNTMANQNWSVATKADSY